MGNTDIGGYGKNYIELVLYNKQHSKLITGTTCHVMPCHAMPRTHTYISIQTIPNSKRPRPSWDLTLIFFGSYIPTDTAIQIDHRLNVKVLGGRSFFLFFSPSVVFQIWPWLGIAFPFSLLFWVDLLISHVPAGLRILRTYLNENSPPARGLYCSVVS